MPRFDVEIAWSLPDGYVTLRAASKTRALAPDDLRLLADAVEVLDEFRANVEQPAVVDDGRALETS